MRKTWVRCKIRPEALLKLEALREDTTSETMQKTAIHYELPPVPSRRGQKIICTGLVISVIRADPENRVTEVALLGVRHGSAKLFVDSSPLESPQEKDIIFSPRINITAYPEVVVRLTLETGDAQKLKLGPVKVECLVT
jgi:hypothetical protein